MTRIRNVLALLSGQLWIIPSVMTALAAVLAWALLRYGFAISSDGTNFWWIYAGDADTARNLLASFLSGMMTMTSLVVSVTFVILTLAANQLGPRLISTFIADRYIQVVLGLFLGTIFYVILVLRTLDDTLGDGGVPHIAVTAASVLTVVCLFALLFYVHKIARAIIADNAVDTVYRALVRDLESMLPARATNERPQALLRRPTVRSVHLGSVGYIQVVDYDALRDVACRFDVVLEIDVRAGHFVLNRGEHVRIRSDGEAAGAIDDEIVAAFVIGSERTPAQDPEHGFRQLVEIGLRALSPGVNDPFTAIAVVDRLSAALEVTCTRELQPIVIADADGIVRVVADRSDAEGIVDAAFNAIRQAGADDPAVLIAIADGLGRLAPVSSHETTRRAISAQLTRLRETTDLGRMTPSDRADVMRRIEAAQTAVQSR